MGQVLRVIAQRTLAVLQRESGDGWIDIDRLIVVTDIHTPNHDRDTCITAVTNVLDQLRAAGYETEMKHSATGIFYRLTCVV